MYVQELPSRGLAFVGWLLAAHVILPWRTVVEECFTVPRPCSWTGPVRLLGSGAMGTGSPASYGGPTFLFVQTSQIYS